MDKQAVWDERAAHFDDWGPPLRPPAVDLALYAAFVAQRFGTSASRVEALLLGVTPELATLEWPVPLDITAVDQSEPMVRRVWPGDVAGQRRAVVGDWMDWQPAMPVDLVLTDGAPVFFAQPQVLFSRAHALLKPGGVFVMRAFCAPPEREPIEAVFEAARAGAIDGFHLFKWRVAMAMQDDPREGVVQHDVWSRIVEKGIDFSRLPQPGFSARAVSTLRFYRDQSARLHFPTQAQYATVLKQVFDSVDAANANYPCSERFTVFMACRND